MKTRFRIKANDSLKLQLLNKEGKLLTTIYDSGFTKLSQCKEALLNKCCNPPRKTFFSIYNEEKDKYWSNF